MEVILLEKIANLGNLGDKVNVKAGYGRNFLLPQGKAVRATKSNRERFESQRRRLKRNGTHNNATACLDLESNRMTR